MTDRPAAFEAEPWLKPDLSALPPPQALPPPGWYQFGPGETRWWDGYQWTTAARANTPGAGSYVVAVAVPIVGVILAIIQFSRSNVGPGFALLGTSIFAWIVAAIVVVALGP